VSETRPASGAWRRLGRLEMDMGRAAPWAVTHAALPVLEPVGADQWNLYVSIRDVKGRARIGRAVFTMHPVPTLSPLAPEPVLDLGALGAFDDSGVTSSCIVRRDRRRYLFYTGWSRGVTVPFYLAAGLAISDDDGAFRRVSEAPILERSAVDPYLTASPFVLVEPDRWRMWYVSGSGWDATEDGPRHRYHLRYAESADGETWQRPGIVCLDYRSAEEYAFARPCVLREGGTYRMWYASRGDRYWIRCAESADGMGWTRLSDDCGLQPSIEGWDSEMVEYPFVFEWRGRRYMLYNGNQYGRSGVGLAVWENGVR
jgi:hypothetical protein